MEGFLTAADPLGTRPPRPSRSQLPPAPRPRAPVPPRPAEPATAVAACAAPDPCLTCRTRTCPPDSSPQQGRAGPRRSRTTREGVRAPPPPPSPGLCPPATARREEGWVGEGGGAARVTRGPLARAPRESGEVTSISLKLMSKFQNQCMGFLLLTSCTLLDNIENKVSQRLCQLWNSKR